MRNLKIPCRRIAGLIILFQILYISTAVSFTAAPCSVVSDTEEKSISTAASPVADCEPEAREYKILLLPENFSDPVKGMTEYWKIAASTAKSLGLKVRETDKPEAEPKRFVTYLDTPSHELKKCGFIFRRRCSKPAESKTCELVLKARSSNAYQAASANVLTTPMHDGTVSFEEDISMHKSPSGSFEPVRLYSRSGSLRLKTEPWNKVKDLSAIFPGLRDLKIPSTTEIRSVRNIDICEHRMKPGKIYFGKFKAKVTLTVWQIVGENKPWIAEFSFTMNLSDKDIHNSKVGQKALDLCRAIMKKTQSWLADGMTKTSMVYGE
ncbi:MAG: hypothetical protein CVV64_08390 [Candidatus Wallbacteria bacterium HGW-Wallbacteria-1]|jgi:hypothetical protein|uniref:Uncharacterized protein n=1 Tax=Candidatus Wallbacteria bacterium HGW-Wallbacteria-1 TaxID=2013854 RepID=A0A2N1PRB5_9BACT|nr:MAG: hypothetical protein CVV64_08390 [Candidatus Wallbacteria bacterium HGW-Wallbacteria-1]